MRFLAKHGWLVALVVAASSATPLAHAAGTGAGKVRLGTFKGTITSEAPGGGSTNPNAVVMRLRAVPSRGKLYMTLEHTDRPAWRQAFNIVSDQTTGQARLIAYTRPGNDTVSGQNNLRKHNASCPAKFTSFDAGLGQVQIAGNSVRVRNEGMGHMSMILLPSTGIKDAAQIKMPYIWHEVIRASRPARAKKAKPATAAAETTQATPSPSTALAAVAPTTP